MFCCLTDVSLKDKILARGSALTFNFMTPFSLATVVYRLLPSQWLPAHETSSLEFVPTFGQITPRVLSQQRPSVLGRATENGRGRWWQTHLGCCKGTKIVKITRRSWLIAILCHPVCFTVALRLVLELTYVTMCNLSWWVPCVDQPQKHNPGQWPGAMPINVCFFFCSLNEMYSFFALSLLTHTFLKQQIMWMFTVYGLVFFFCYCPRK